MTNIADSVQVMFLDPHCRWCVPLGLSHPWCSLGKKHRLLHRMVELLRMDLRLGIHCIHPRQRFDSDVFSLPPRLHYRGMAYICRLCLCGLGQLRFLHLRQPLTTNDATHWIVLGHCRRHHHNHCCRSDAQAAREQRFRMERLGQCHWLGKRRCLPDWCLERSVHHRNPRCHCKDAEPYVLSSTNKCPRLTWLKSYLTQEGTCPRLLRHRSSWEHSVRFHTW